MLRKFVDKVQIECRGGKGGNGCVSFLRLSPTKKRPSGGSGGQGGNVYIVADQSLTNLSFETFHFNAGDGGHGGGEGRTGRRGKDVEIRVPLGTVLREYIRDDSTSSSSVTLMYACKYSQILMVFVVTRGRFEVSHGRQWGRLS